MSCVWWRPLACKLTLSYSENAESERAERLISDVVSYWLLLGRKDDRCLEDSIQNGGARSASKSNNLQLAYQRIFRHHATQMEQLR